MPTYSALRSETSHEQAAIVFVLSMMRWFGQHHFAICLFSERTLANQLQRQSMSNNHLALRVGLRFEVQFSGDGLFLCISCHKLCQSKMLPQIGRRRSIIGFPHSAQTAFILSSSSCDHSWRERVREQKSSLIFPLHTRKWQGKQSSLNTLASQVISPILWLSKCALAPDYNSHEWFSCVSRFRRSSSAQVAHTLGRTQKGIGAVMHRIFLFLFFRLINRKFFQVLYRSNLLPLTNLSNLRTFV